MASRIPIEQYLDRAVYAKRAVPIYRVSGTEESGPKWKIVHWAKRGDLLGKPREFIGPSPLTKFDTYLQYYDVNGRPYQTKFIPEDFSLSSLKDQGAKTEKEIQTEREKWDEPSSAFDFSWLTGSTPEDKRRRRNWIIGGAAFLLALKALPIIEKVTPER